MPNRLLLSLFLAMIASSSLCAQHPNMLTLADGSHVKVLQLGRVRFSDETPALVLTYGTRLKIRDADALRKQVDQVWEVFRPTVEKAKYSTGIVHPAEVDGSNQPVKGGESRDVIFKRIFDGRWRCLDDNPQPKPKTGN
jgi:hypothetical protein